MIMKLPAFDNAARDLYWPKYLTCVWRTEKEWLFLAALMACKCVSSEEIKSR